MKTNIHIGLKPTEKFKKIYIYLPRYRKPLPKKSVRKICIVFVGKLAKQANATRIIIDALASMTSSITYQNSKVLPEDKKGKFAYL